MNAANERESTRWRLAPGQQLHARGWDGEHLVYNDISGDTHLLTDAALLLLRALQHEACSQQALGRLVKSIDGTPETEDSIDSLLLDLEALFLIECLAC